MLHFKTTKRGNTYQVTQITKGTVHFVYEVDANSKEDALDKIQNKVNDPNFEPLEEADKVQAFPDYDDTASYEVKEID